MNEKFEHSSCRAEDLTLYYYRELTGNRRRRMEIHLEECEGCRQELEQMRSTLQDLPPGNPVFAPAEIRAFNERVSRRIRRGFRLPFGVPLGWSAVGAAALLFALTLQSTPPKPDPPSPGAVALQGGKDIENLPDPDLLLNMELLENLDLLQELEGSGLNG